jgi:hypothetical protein
MTANPSLTDRKQQVEYLSGVTRSAVKFELFVYLSKCKIEYGLVIGIINPLKTEFPLNNI